MSRCAFLAAALIVLLPARPCFAVDAKQQMATRQFGADQICPQGALIHGILPKRGGRGHSLGSQFISVPNIIQAVYRYVGWLAGSSFFSKHSKPHVSPEAYCSRLDRDVSRQYRGRRVAARTA